MKNLTTGCGDWMLGWGYSGYDKVGKLTKIAESSFIWSGQSCGRYGQEWNKNARLEFSYSGGKIEVKEQKGGAPVESCLIEAAELLNRMYIEKLKKRK